MTVLDRIDVSHTTPPRARGEVVLSVGAGGRIERLRQSASLKALFPRTDGPAKQAVLVNTAGGATGGDRFDVSVTASPGAHLTVTTQAAERAYRAQPGETARVQNRLTVGNGARLNWVPQEMILFNGSALDRRLSVDLGSAAEICLCETLVFGRAAMGETVTNLRLSDRVDIRRDGAPLFLDQMRLDGDAAAHLGRPTLGGGAQAVTLLLVVSPQAEAFHEAIRPKLPLTGGVSLIRDDCLVARILAPDSFELRASLVPILQHLVGELPRPWKI